MTLLDNKLRRPELPVSLLFHTEVFFSKSKDPCKNGHQGVGRVFLQGGWDASSWAAEVWSSPRGTMLV